MPSFTELRQFLGGQILQTPNAVTTDLSGRTIIVTGGNTGLGLECAKQLTTLNISKLILACRDLKKGETARQAILAQSLSPARCVIEVWQVDLDNYQSVLCFAKRVQTQLPRLDGLVANAGISLEEFSMSEGHERTLTINVISTFLLAVLILPKLQESVEMYDINANLTVVGSMIHIFAPHEQLLVPEQTTILDVLSNPEKADMSRRYFLSKLLVHQCTRELAGQLSASSKNSLHQVVVNCVNPGWCKTELFRNEHLNMGQKIGLAMIGRTSVEGARTLTHGVIAGLDTHGRYLSECQEKNESNWVRSAEGLRVQKRLWKELSTIMNGVSPGVTDTLR